MNINLLLNYTKSSHIFANMSKTSDLKVNNRWKMDSKEKKSLEFRKNKRDTRNESYYNDNYKSNINFFLSLLFLLPVCFVVGFYSIDLIEMSWKIKEASTEAGGLKYVYLQKTLVILFPITLTLTFIYQILS